MLPVRSSHPRLALLLLAGAFLLQSTFGCNSAAAPKPKNFIKGLDAYFLDHPECLFPESPTFPFETTDPVKTKQMNTLVTAKLLTVGVEAAIHASRYTPTDAGARIAPRFCYGHRVVTSIDSFTPPAAANGLHETRVSYHYRLEEVPVWAKSADLRAAFPSLALETSGSAADTTTLADNITGWQVPD